MQSLNVSLYFQIPLSLKENQTLGEVGIVFKKAHRNIILVLPPSAAKQQVEKSSSQKNIVADDPKKTDELIVNNEAISPATDLSVCEQSGDLKPEASTKKKIIKVKTLKTGTKTVKIKSEKTTTVTLENGEVKKKTVKKQTDTTTVQLPNGVTNGVTSEECIVTKSIHTTNGDHFEERNVEISSFQTEAIERGLIDDQLSLSDRRSSSTDIDGEETKFESKNNQLEVNGFDKHPLRKDRSASPIQFNFVVGKKSLKQKLIIEKDKSPEPTIDISVVSQPEPISDCNETNRKLSHSEASITSCDAQNSHLSEQVDQKEEQSTSASQTKVNERSETSPARFHVQLNGSSTNELNQSQKEASFQRSEVSPARFTIKLAKKKVEVVEPKEEIRVVKEASTEPEVYSTTKPEPEISSEPIAEPQPEACSTVEINPEPTAEPEPEASVQLNGDISKDDVDHTVIATPESEIVLNENNSAAEKNFEAETNHINVSDIEVKSIASEDIVKVETVPEPKTEVDVKEQDLSKTVTVTKVEAESTEVIPKIKTVRKIESNGDIGVKVLKSKIGSKLAAETDATPKPVVGLKDVVLKKAKKVTETNGLPVEAGTTEVKKRLVKKVIDPITGEVVKKKVVKKVVGSTTENGTGEVKKVLKKKSEVASDVAPDTKVKITKKKVETVTTDAVDEIPKSNTVEDPKVESPVVAEEITKSNTVEDPKVESSVIAEEITKSNIEEDPIVESSVVVEEITQSNIAVDTKLESSVVGAEIPKSKIIDEPKVESAVSEVPQTEVEKIVENKTTEDKIEPKMDEYCSNPLNGIGPLFDDDRKDRSMLELDDQYLLSANTQKFYDETPLFISTTPQEQHDLTLGLPLSDKNRRERQMLGMDEDLALGASASPVESKSETANNYIPLAICDTPSSSTDYAGKLYSG